MLRDMSTGAKTTESVRQTLRVLRRVAGDNGNMLRSRAPEILARAARVILDEPSPLASLAFQAGVHCGLSRPMVREGLMNLLGTVTAESLRTVQRRGCTKSGGEVVFHVLSGNLFMPGIESMILASLRGAASLVRTSASDPLFPRLWAEALRIADPEFDASLAVLHWPHTDTPCFEAAMDGADIVVVYGGDATVASLASLVRQDHIFLGHGTRHSFAIVDATALTPDHVHETARRVAYDVSVYDQHGCLSPRAVFVAANGPPTPCEFAVILAREMDLLARRLPRHPLTLEESAALARERDSALLDAALGADRKVISLPTQPFLITLGNRPAGTLSATNRHADIRPFSDPEEVFAALQPFAGSISTLGIAGSTERWRSVLAGVSPARICSVGDMQKPPLGCCHDGVAPLADLCL